MLEIIFWSFFALMIYSYLGYPLILFILSIFFHKKTKSSEITPTVSILIPVYNEEKIIESKIKNILSLDYPNKKLEIIVASESNDKTNEIVKKYKAHGVKLFTYSKRKGKQYTIYRTLPKCKGEIIVLTDANGIFRKDAIKKLVRNFKDPRIGCVSGRLKYINPFESSAGKGESFYWDYETLIKKLESNFQSLLGANGSIYAIRKDLYKPISPYRSDDFDIPIRIILQKYGVILEPEAISEEEVYPQTLSNFKRKMVIVGWHFTNALILLKESIEKFNFFLAFQLISHKILRWLGGFFMIFIFTSNIFLLKNIFYLNLFLLQTLFYLLGILAYFQDRQNKNLNRLINLIYYFCMINLASLFGVINGILGRQKATWEKLR